MKNQNYLARLIYQLERDFQFLCGLDILVQVFLLLMLKCLEFVMILILKLILDKFFLFSGTIDTGTCTSDSKMQAAHTDTQILGETGSSIINGII